jgi:hypothetical protein
MFKNPCWSAIMYEDPFADLEPDRQPNGKSDPDPHPHQIVAVINNSG